MHAAAAAARFVKSELRGTRTVLALREASTNWHHVVLDCNVSASNDFLVQGWTNLHQRLRSEIDTEQGFLIA